MINNSFPKQKLFTVKTTAGTSGSGNKLFSIPKIKVPAATNPKVQEITNQIASTGRTLTGPLKGTNAVIPGDSAYSQFQTYNQYGNLSTDINLSDPKLREAVLLQAEADGKIPKGTTVATVGESNFGTTAVNGIMRVLNFFMLDSFTELTLGNAWRTMFGPEVRARAEGLKAGKTEEQINQERAIPKGLNTIFWPFQLAKEAVVKWYNDLDATFGGTGVRQEDFNPTTLAIADITQLKDALAGMSNRTETQNIELNLYTDTLNTLNSDSPLTAWMKTSEVQGLWLVGPVAGFLYPMFKTWGNILDVGVYTVGEAMGGFLGNALGTPLTLTSKISKFLKLDEAKRGFTLGRNLEGVDQAMTAIHNAADARTWLAKVAEDIPIDSITEKNWQTLVNDVGKNLKAEMFTNASIVEASLYKNYLRTAGSKASWVDIMAKDSGKAWIAERTKLFQTAMNLGSKVSAGEKLILNDVALSMYQKFQKEYIDYGIELSRIMKKEGRTAKTVSEIADATILNPELRLIREIKKNPFLFLENETQFIPSWGELGKTKEAVMSAMRERYNIPIGSTYADSLVKYFQKPLVELTQALLGPEGAISGIFLRRFPIEISSVSNGVRDYIMRVFNLDNARLMIDARYRADIATVLQSLSKVENNSTLRDKLFGRLLLLGKKEKGSFFNLDNLSGAALVERRALIREYAFGMFYENRDNVLLQNFIKRNKDVRGYVSSLETTMVLVARMQIETGVVIENMVKNYFPHMNFTTHQSGLAGPAVPRTYETLTEALDNGQRFLADPSQAYLALFEQYKETAARGLIYTKALSQFVNTSQMIFGSPRLLGAALKNKTLGREITKITIQDNLIPLLNTSLSEGGQRELAVKMLAERGIITKIDEVTKKIKLKVVPKFAAMEDYIATTDELRKVFPTLLKVFQKSTLSNDRVLQLLVDNLLKSTEVALSTERNLVATHLQNTIRSLINKAKGYKTPEEFIAAFEKLTQGLTPGMKGFSKLEDKAKKFAEQFSMYSRTKAAKKIITEDPNNMRVNLLEQFFKDATTEIAYMKKSKTRGAIMGLGDIQRRVLALLYLVDAKLPGKESPLYIGASSVKDLVDFGGVKGIKAFAENPLLMLTKVSEDLGILDMNIPEVINATQEITNYVGLHGATNAARADELFTMIMGEGKQAKQRKTQMRGSLFGKKPSFEVREVALGNDLARYKTFEEYIADKKIVDYYVRDAKIVRGQVESIGTGKNKTEIFDASSDRTAILPPGTKGKRTQVVYLIPGLKNIENVDSSVLKNGVRVYRGIRKLLSKAEIEEYKLNGVGVIGDGNGDLLILDKSNLISRANMMDMFDKTRAEMISNSKKAKLTEAEIVRGKKNPSRLRPGTSNPVKKLMNTYDSFLSTFRTLLVTYSIGLPIKSALGNAFNDAFLFSFSGLRNLDEVMKITRLTIDYMRVAPELSVDKFGDNKSTFVNTLINKVGKIKRYNTKLDDLGALEAMHRDPMYLSLSDKGKKVIDLLENASYNVRASLGYEYGKNWQIDGLDAATYPQTLLESLAKNIGTENKNLLNITRKLRNVSNKWVRDAKKDHLGFAYMNTLGDYMHKVSAAFRFVEKYADPVTQADEFSKYFTAFRDLGQTEQMLHRRVFQFYLWQRNNFMNYVRAVFGQDSDMTRSFVLFGRALQIAQDPELQDAIARLPDSDYRKNLLWVGNKESYIMGLNTPLEGFYNFSRLIPFMATGKGDPMTSLQDTLKAYVENFNLPASAAMALVSNQDIRTGRVIDPFRSTSIQTSERGFTLASEITKNLIIGLPKGIQDEFGWIKKQNSSTKANEYYVDPWLNYFISKNPILAINTLIPMIPTEDQLPNERPPLSILSDTLSGFRLRGLLDYTTLDAVGKNALNDKLGKLLQEAGLMNIVETTQMTPLQTYTVGLPQTVEMQQKALAFRASPLTYKQFNEFQKILKTKKAKAVKSATKGDLFASPFSK